jgi:hypothetical protein
MRKLANIIRSACNDSTRARCGLPARFNENTRFFDCGILSSEAVWKVEFYHAQVLLSLNRLSFTSIMLRPVITPGRVQQHTGAADFLVTECPCRRCEFRITDAGTNCSRQELGRRFEALQSARSEGDGVGPSGETFVRRTSDRAKRKRSKAGVP